ncbi:MAG: hypothetical protein ACREX3_17110 [Gammaproteobacteria bacterium]
MAEYEPWADLSHAAITESIKFLVGQVTGWLDRRRRKPAEIEADDGRSEPGTEIEIELEGARTELERLATSPALSDEDLLYLESVRRLVVDLIGRDVVVGSSPHLGKTVAHLKAEQVAGLLTGIRGRRISSDRDIEVRVDVDRVAESGEVVGLEIDEL